MNKDTANPPSPFERFVAALLKVPKSQADKVARSDAKPREKRGPKPKS